MVEDSAFVFSWTKVWPRSEEHTSELQSQSNLVCRLLLEKKNIHFEVVEVGPLRRLRTRRLAWVAACSALLVVRSAHGTFARDPLSCLHIMLLMSARPRPL